MFKWEILDPVVLVARNPVFGYHLSRTSSIFRVNTHNLKPVLTDADNL